MLTDRQRMQIRRQIGHKHGFLPETVLLMSINNVMKNIVIEDGSIEIEVEFYHKTGHWGTEIFKFNPSDMRLMPIIIKGESEC